MNFIIFKDVNDNSVFCAEEEVTSVPKNTISFTYYDQSLKDDDGYCPSVEYRIGTPVILNINPNEQILSQSDLDKRIMDNDFTNIYSVYEDNGVMHFYPMNNKIILVDSYEELEECFSELLSIGKQELRLK